MNGYIKHATGDSVVVPNVQSIRIENGVAIFMRGQPGTTSGVVTVAAVQLSPGWPVVSIGDEKLKREG